MLALRIVRVVNQYAALSAAKTGDNFVVAIPVHVGRPNRVPVYQRIVNDLTLPLLTLLPVHGYLTAVPRLDGRDKPLPAQMSHGHIARSALRPRCRIALHNLSPAPSAVFSELIEIDSHEARRQNVLAPVS